MAKHRGKKYLEVAKLVETGKLYDIREALELVKKQELQNLQKLLK